MGDEINILAERPGFVVAFRLISETFGTLISVPRSFFMVLNKERGFA